MVMRLWLLGVYEVLCGTLVVIVFLLFPDFITLCCYIMAPIVFQLVTTIFWVVLGGASIKSVLLYYVYTQKT